MTKEAVDAAFVVNADVTRGAIRSLAEEHQLLSAVFVSTHQYYPNEVEAITSIFADGAKFLTFADLLSASDLDEADEQARQALDRAETPPGKYVQGYEAKISRLKNDWVRARLESMFEVERVFCADGLGVIAAAWASPITIPLQDTPLSDERSPARRAMARLLRTRRYALYSALKQSYLLVGTAKRVPFVSRVCRWSATLPEVFGNLLIQATRVLPASKRPQISCSIHDRSHWASHVFVDGYHPSNYPYSYLGSFRKDTTFLVPTRLNGAWFERFGFAVEVRPELLQEPEFQRVENPEMRGKARILLLLNHAGDWAAIINRSDTERLVIAFCEMAKEMPGTEFLVRPHPTAIHPRHEGQFAISRIHDYVSWLGYSNLFVSNSTLEEDIDGADLCISEYSLTLINCYAKGKPALVANLTGRRSLMEDYQQFGFAHVDTNDALKGAVNDFVVSPGPFIEAQNAAVGNYGKALHDCGSTTDERCAHDT